MEKILVSKSKIIASARTVICVACALIFLCGVASFILREADASDRLRIILYPIGLFISYLFYVMYYIVGFYGGVFYIGREGVGIKLPFRKRSFFSWSEIEECGVIQLTNMSVAYFATKHVTIEDQNRIFNGKWSKGTKMMAFAELDQNFVEKAFPFIPEAFAETMRKYARFEGVGSSAKADTQKCKIKNEVKGSFYNGNDPGSKVSLIVSIALVLLFLIIAYIIFTADIFGVGEASLSVNEVKIIKAVFLVFDFAFMILPIISILDRYLSVSINEYGICCRYCIPYVRTIPWREVWNTRINIIQTKNGPRTVVLFAINSRTGRTLSDEKKLCAFANEAFIDELKWQDIIVYDDRE